MHPPTFFKLIIFMAVIKVQSFFDFVFNIFGIGDSLKVFLMQLPSERKRRRLLCGFLTSKNIHNFLFRNRSLFL